MWACTNCHKRLSRKLTTCPKCGGKANYICAECYKDLPDGKHNYCGFHQQQKHEELMESLKKAGEVAGGAVAAVVLTPVKKVINDPEVIKDVADRSLHKQVFETLVATFSQGVNYETYYCITAFSCHSISFYCL